MNYRKGLTRIAIVWIGFWGLWYWNGYDMQMNAERRFLEASEKQHDFMIEYQLKMMTRGGEMIGQALIYGLLVPITLMIVAGVAFWVWRGFKSKSAGGIA